MNKLQVLNGYVDRGWYIFPLRDRAKEPRFTGSFANATNDKKLIQKWNDQFPNANWGIYPGKSAIVVIDIDTAKGADSKALGELPPTLTVTTGTGGLHLYYAKPEGMRIGNNHSHLPKHWDVRCDKGYAVIPPSTHPNGREYAFENDLPIAELPKVLVELLTEKWSLSKDSYIPNSSDEDKKIAFECVAKLDPKRADDYESWVLVGMALKGLEEFGLTLWDDWSKKSPKYQLGQCAQKWESFKSPEEIEHDNKITLGSLIHWAKEDSPSVITPAPRDPRPSDYVKALEQLGYKFKLNIANNEVIINGTPEDDIIRAALFTQLRESGYKSTQYAQDAWTFEASKAAFHPITEYLRGLRWDGEDHIAKLCSYFQDKQNVFPLWIKRWLIGATAKVLASPRGQQTRMLILDGKQDQGKSYFVRWLASPVPEYFIEGSINPEDKDSWVRKISDWIWEVAELGSTIRKADREALKNFISEESVTVRKSYGHRDTKKPALSNFIGTINDEIGFLNDPTGSRRFMVCTLNRINWNYCKEVDINQVWAQAVHLFESGEPWDLTAEEKELANQINSGYEIDNPIAEYILRLFEIDPDEESWFIPTGEIMDALKQQNWVSGYDQSITNRVGSACMILRLQKDRRRIEGYSQAIRGWVGIRPKQNVANEMVERLFNQN